MRRSLVYYILGGLAVLIVSAMLAGTNRDAVHRRYHQHLEQPSEAALGDCGRDHNNGDNDTTLCTHLPVMVIDTGGAKIPGRATADENGVLTYETSDNGEEQIIVSLYTVDTAGVWHHPDDAPTHASQALFRIRGNSSRWFDKPNYRIQLVEDDNPELENSLPLLGMAESDEWALHGPFMDKSLMRNYVWMNKSAEIMGYAPNVRFFELILDGQYQGVYVLMETIRMQEGRVELTKYNEGDPVMSYLVRLDSYINPDKLIDDFVSYTKRHEIGSDTEVLYPGLLMQTEYVHNYIKADLSEIEKTLYSLDMMLDSEAYERLINVDSFVDYYILQEFLAVNDSLSRSTFFYKDVRGKLTIGPAWDYNNALDNFMLPMPGREFILSQRLWYSQLMTNRDFVERIIKRWHELRNGILSETQLLQYNTEVELWLGTAVHRNFEVWGYSFDPDQLTVNSRRQPGPRDVDLTIYDVNPSSYSEAMEWMLDFMMDRGQFLDEHIHTLRQHSHFSRNPLKDYTY